MEKLAVCLFNFVDCLNHMNGNSYGSCLIGYRSCYSLTNPPCGIGGELKALSVVEFINRLYKTKVALLNQIKELHTSADITFGNADYKTKVCFGKTLFSLLISVGYTHCELLLSGKKRNTSYFLKIHLDRIIHSKIMRIGTCCRSGILTLRQFGIKVQIVQFDIAEIINDFYIHAFDGFIELIKLFHIEIFLNYRGVNFLRSELAG